MTLSSTTSVAQYDGDGSTTSFPTVFKFNANEDVRVTLKPADGSETVWTENTQYTLTGAGVDGGGTVTVVTAPVDHTPATGASLVIERVTTQTQETDYPEGGAFPAVAHENALDKLTMMVQELSGRLTRSLRFPVSDPVSLSAVTPNAQSRANRYLAFDANGAPVATAGPAGDSSIPVSPFMETMLDDPDAATARATLGLGAAAVLGVAAGGSGGLLRADGDASSLVGVWTTGDIKATLRAAAPAGWLMLNGDSIGSAASAADQANDALEPLFAALWDDLADTEAPVSGGRGASATADWAANKTLTLPDSRGRAIIGAGTGAGLTARTLGDATIGEEEHTLTVAEMPSHTHTVSSVYVFAGASPDGNIGSGSQGRISGSKSTEPSGSDEAHNNMQPSLVANWMVKI